ncbi:MAG: hypothetical protein WCP21_00340 [Armatimonadota bacterium]
MVSRRRAVGAVLVVIAVAMLGAAAWAQDAPKAPGTYTDFVIGLGAQHQSITGNERYFDRYVTQPADVYPSRALWQQLDYSGGTSFSAEGLDLGEPGASGTLWLRAAGTNLEADYRRSTFYQEFDSLSGRNRRRDYAVSLTSDAALGRRGYTWGVGGSDVAMAGAPSSGVVDWESRNHNATLGVQSHNTWFDFSFNREDFDLRTGDGLSGDTQSYLLSITPAVAQRAQISGALARNITHLDRFGGGVRSWDANVTALYPVSDSFDLSGQIRRYSIDQTITRNAYARQQLTGRVDAEYRLLPGTTLSAYYQNASTNYLDGLQANGLTVGSNTEQLALRSRLTRALKVTGKYTRYDTDHRPLAYNVDNSFAPSLVYSTLKRLDVSASYAPVGLWGLTGQFTKHDWENDAQLINNSLQTTAVTGWWQTLGGRLSTTASYLRQDFTLPLLDLATQQGYESRTISWVLGSTYALSSATSLYANYSDVNTNGATANEFRRVTLGATRDIGRDDHLLGEVNLGNCWDDLVASQNYGADLYRMEWQHKF